MKVSYIKKDDKYIVTSIDNILSADEIIERYGERAAKIYLTNKYNVTRHKNHTIFMQKIGTFVYLTSPIENLETFGGVFIWPFVLTEAQFYAFILRLSVAGEALASAIKQAHEEEKFVYSLIHEPPFEPKNHKVIEI
jgi:hypothetical protein